MAAAHLFHTRRITNYIGDTIPCLSVALPVGGGVIEYKDYWGNEVTWKAWYNYPAPWWNHWWVFLTDVDGVVYGPYSEWWYGTWWGR